MEYFRINSQFDDYKSIMEMKKQYEKASNSLLYKEDCVLLPDRDSDFGKRFVYQRIVFKCKAGPERKTQSKGIRNSSTFKKNCPVKVRIILKKEKFLVTQSSLNHENHNTDKATYDHYPENLRIPPEKLPEVKKMISLGAKKQLIKMDLMSDGKTIVPLKVLHNIQSAIQTEKQNEFGDANELESVLKKLQEIPNARIRVVTNEKNELIGIFFQGDRMAQIFGKYPEVMLYDTTYKMNNKDLPLVLQLCVDGNGETEISSIFVAQSESRLCVGAMVDIFQELNPAWRKTRVIIGDKDFADRAIYTEKFPDAVLQICLYHVLVNFRREITTIKRNITKNEREAALDVIQRLIYSTSEESYDSAYQELVDLNLKDVMQYYNDNWHTIRDEWTLYGRNKFANYLNWTNNRTESINQKFKMLANRYANLFSFFTNLFSTVAVLASERNIRAVQSTMRVSRTRFKDESLAKYSQLLTSFIFKKIQEQYELSKIIEFATLTAESGITKNAHDVGHTVTEQNCSCMYFSAMKIPCRHIFQFLKLNEMDLYVPDLVDPRWTLAYFYKSHPALNNYQHIAAPRPISFSTIRVPEEIEKYKKTAKLTKDINNFVASMSNGQFQFFYDKINDMRNEIISTNNNATPEHSFGAAASASTNQHLLHQSTIASNATPIVPFEYGTTNEMNGYRRRNISATVTSDTAFEANTSTSMVPSANGMTNELNCYRQTNISERVTTGRQTVSMLQGGYGTSNELNGYRRTNIPATVTSDTAFEASTSTSMGSGANGMTNELNCYRQTNIPETLTTNRQTASMIDGYGMTNEINWERRTDIPEAVTSDRATSNGTSMVSGANGMTNEINWYRRTNIPETVTLNQSFATTNATSMVPGANGKTNEENCFRSSDFSESTTHKQSYSQQQVPLKQPQFNASASQPTIRNDMQRIILPPGIVPVGRPKGTGMTAIGLKRKNPVKHPANSSPPTKKIKFFDRKVAERGPLVVQWLTNWPLDKIGTKKVTNGDIIQDPIIFNRLKHKNLDLKCIKKFLDKKTFDYISKELDRLKEMPYTCTKCKKYLNGLQIMCHGCLDWYHGKCIGITNDVANELYFCSTC